MKPSIAQSTLSNSLRVSTSDEFQASPFFSAIENFSGAFVDLDREERTTADEWKRQVRKIYRELQSHGIEPGDRVLVALPNGAGFAATWAAILQAGGAPFLAHFETPEPELAALAKRWSVKLIAVELGIRRSLPNVAQGVFPALPSVVLHPTSGSAGQPKVAVRPGPCAVAEALHYVQTLGIDQSDVILCMSPMSHAYAYGMCLMVPLLVSAEILVTRRFNPKLAVRAIAERRVTIVPAVPAVLDLISFPEAVYKTRVRAVLSAGSPLAARTASKYREQYKTNLRPLLGSTETGGISIAADEEFDESVGHPMEGVDVRIAELACDSGLLEVRSSSMMAGYLTEGGIDATAISDGWFRPGDLACLHNGKIFLRGRVSDEINVFGLKVLPAEVEGVIAALPEVIEVKVYGGRHRSGSDVVQAALVCSRPISENALRDHCRRHLIAYKCPVAFYLMEALPRTPQGKIAVRRLPQARST